MIINHSNLGSLFTAYSAAFKGAFDQASPQWEAISTLVPSSTSSNLYGFLGHFPKLREWLGDRQVKNLVAHDYTVVNKKFEATVGVPRDNIEDDSYGVYSPLMQEMGYSAALHPDEIVFALLAAGATELCFDGQAFFSASHPIVVDGVAGTASNYDSGGGGNLWVLMDVRRPLKPLLFQKRRDYKFQAFNKPEDEHVFMRDEYLFGVDARCAAGFGVWQLAYGSLNTLNATQFESYEATMLARKSDEGKPLGIRPGLCVVGPSNLSAARSLFELQYLASGATNPHYKACEILVSPYLT